MVQVDLLFKHNGEFKKVQNSRYLKTSGPENTGGEAAGGSREPGTRTHGASTLSQGTVQLRVRDCRGAGSEGGVVGSSRVDMNN